jgi:parallel beta-helix repeat protein
MAALGNGSRGIAISGNSSYNVIGGGTSGPGGYCAGECNLISGNGTPDGYHYGVRISESGATHNTISGNYVGTNADGTAAIPNSWTGVSLSWGTQYNVIERNLISGNGHHGVDVWREGTDHNQVRGNYIGTNADGTGPLGNGTMGVYIALGAQDNLIGGDTAADRNLISGNNGLGVLIETANNTKNNIVKGNYIGTDVSGTGALGNGSNGVLIREGVQHNTIESNLISGNGSHGVFIYDSDTTNNTVTENSIYNNTGKGIKLDDGGNLELFAPIITNREFDRVSGSAPPYSTVEIFSDNYDEGQVFEGSTTADGSGNFAFDQPGGFALSKVTATATDADGNTSEFSEEYPETHDMELVTIFSVKAKVSVGEAIMPAVEVGNAGSSTESSVPVQVRVTTDPGGTEVYSRTQTVGSINPLNYEFLEFEAWTPAATGNYRLEASVTLPGDGNTANDTKEVAIMAVMDNPEVYIKSKDGDDGSVPQYHYWKSPDLWVRHNQDGLEEPEQPMAGQTNYAYARVHNIGDATLNDVTVDLYWHEPALGIKCGNWQHIGVYTITLLSPGVTETVHLPWTPDVSGYTCLFAKVDSDQDPYARGHDCYEGVVWDNNLAQRNLEVVESAAAQVGAMSVAGIRLDVVNVRSKPAPVDVVVEKMETFAGTLTLDLGDELFNRWQNATAGTVEGGQIVSGTTKVQITAPVSGTVVGLPLYGDEEREVVLEAEGQSGLELEVEVVEWIDGLLIGGNTYQLKLPYDHHLYLPIMLKGHSSS